MSKKLLGLIGGVLIVIIIGLYIMVLSYQEDNLYHRSKMHENAFLVDLVKIYPVGTSMQTILMDLNVDSGCVQNYPAKEGSYLSVKPLLYISESEIRDYYGFTFEFSNGLLLDIHPTGHDCPGKPMDLSRLIYLKKKPVTSNLLGQSCTEIKH